MIISTMDSRTANRNALPVHVPVQIESCKNEQKLHRQTLA